MKLLGLTALVGTVVQALPELSISKQARHPRQLHTRSVKSNFWDDGYAWYTNITVGTPPQPQTVQIDTGSSDLWVRSSVSQICREDIKSCNNGTFDSSMSRTYTNVSDDEGFDIEYVDNSYAEGPYARDVVGIGNVALSLQFGVGVNTSIQEGVLGIGYPQNEATNKTYPNLIDTMASTDVINSKLYSIYLASRSDTTEDIFMDGAAWGTILFGGIDTSKFTGPLTTLNLLPTVSSNGILTNEVVQFITAVTGFRSIVDGETHTAWANGSSGLNAYTSNDHGLPVVLDTGTSISWVPPDFYGKIVRSLPYLNESGYCACDDIGPSDSIELTFGREAQIKISASELIVPLSDFNGGHPVLYGDTGKDACWLYAIGTNLNETKISAIIGDSILRSMYVVFDLDNGQVSIAQAAKDTVGPSNIVEVQAGPNGIANAVPGAVTAPSNTWFIGPAITGNISNTVFTLATPLGTATGTDARPTIAPDSTTALTTFITSIAPTTTTSHFLTPPTSIAPTPTTIYPTPPASPSTVSCPTDGALVCNGDNEFGICNFGQVIWQPVAPGTACRETGIIGVGIYAIPSVWPPALPSK